MGRARPRGGFGAGCQHNGAARCLDPLGPGDIGGRTRLIGYHPTQHDTLFGAAVSGGIWRSDDSGATWRPLLGSEDAGIDGWRMVFGGDGRDVVIDPENPQTIYVETQWANIVKSVNGGRNSPRAREDSIRVGRTCSARRRTISLSRPWMVDETGFGPIVTEWLSLLRDASGRKRLFAFTHGRGVWRVDLR